MTSRGANDLSSSSISVFFFQSVSGMKSCLQSPTGRLRAGGKKKKKGGGSCHDSKVDQSGTRLMLNHSCSLQRCLPFSLSVFSSRPRIPCSSNSSDTFASKRLKTQAGETPPRYAFFFFRPPPPKPRTVWPCNFNG